MLTVVAFTQWLSQTPMSLAIQTHEWAIPTIQSIHIVAIGIVLTSVFMMDLRILGGAGRDQSLLETTARFGPWLSGALYFPLQDFAVTPGWGGGNPWPDPPFLHKGLIDLYGNPKPAFSVVAAIFRATVSPPTCDRWMRMKSISRPLTNGTHSFGLLNSSPMAMGVLVCCRMLLK